MLDRYKQLREMVIENISILQTFFSGRNNGKIVETFNTLKIKLLDNRFNLVVLGQFKRGKSTFINSILGDALLPTSVIPLTSIVTILKYGDRESIQVFFEDSTMIEIPRIELPDYVTERGNPDNLRGVKQVEISFPSDCLKEGVSIIDTPGVGSTFEGNTEMTYNYLPNVDAALFLLAVDPPISRSEVIFLNDVRQHVEKIFFIQNKIDRLDKKEMEESLSFSREIIEKTLGKDSIRIYPLSARMALEGKLAGDRSAVEKSGLNLFDKALGEFLMKAKGKTILNNALNSIKKILADEEMAIELESRAIATPMDELEEKIRVFRRKMDDVKQDREDTHYHFEGEINRLIDLLDRDLERLKSQSITGLLSELEKADKDKDQISDYVDFLDSTIHKGIIRIFDEWVRQEEERLNREYSRVSMRYSERANEIIEAILRTSAELFDIRLEKIETSEAISSDSGLYYMTGETPKFYNLEGAFDFFSQKILPVRLSRRMVLKEMKNKLPGKVDQNCGRVRWDFMNRIKKSFMDFRWDLNLKIDAVEEGIRQAIEKAVELKQKGSLEMEKAQTLLLEDLNKISRIKGNLQEIHDLLENEG